MKYKFSAILLGIVLSLSALLLTGCGGLKQSFNPQDLYMLPKLSAKYTELSEQIDEVLSNGAEYAAPTSGTNTQSVQLVDLNGDGQEEAVAFFRNSALDKPLQVYIFSVNEDHYQQVGMIEGSGTGIYSVAYNDLDGDGRKELLVSWKTTVELQVLEIYDLRNTGPELLLRTSYVKYAVLDMNEDGKKEIVALRTDEESGITADYYDWGEAGSLASRSSARISATAAELSQKGKVRTGVLKDGEAAVFVTGVTEIPRAITDILMVQNQKISNIVLSESTGVSSQIVPYTGLYPMDINDDGITEMPCPVALPAIEDIETQYLTEWKTCNRNGRMKTVLETYHNLQDGWYLRLPSTWKGKIGVFRTVSADEATVIFCWMGQKEATPFLKITAITGKNREMKAVQGERFLLARQEEVIYTAELPGGDDMIHGVTADAVCDAFRPILPEWRTSDN